MRRAQRSQSRVRHQRSVGRYHSPYQYGGTIIRSPRSRFDVSTYPPYERDPMILRSLRQRAKQKGGKLHQVTYPWQSKGQKRIKRRRRRRKAISLSTCHLICLTFRTLTTGMKPSGGSLSNRLIPEVALFFLPYPQAMIIMI